MTDFRASCAPRESGSSPRTAWTTRRPSSWRRWWAPRRSGAPPRESTPRPGAHQDPQPAGGAPRDLDRKARGPCGRRLEAARHREGSETFRTDLDDPRDKEALKTELQTRPPGLAMSGETPLPASYERTLEVSQFSLAPGIVGASGTRLPGAGRHPHPDHAHQSFGRPGSRRNAGAARHARGAGAARFLGASDGPSRRGDPRPWSGDWRSSRRTGRALDRTSRPFHGRVGGPNGATRCDAPSRRPDGSRRGTRAERHRGLASGVCRRGGFPGRGARQRGGRRGRFALRAARSSAVPSSGAALRGRNRRGARIRPCSRRPWLPTGPHWLRPCRARPALPGGSGSGPGPPGPSEKRCGTTGAGHQGLPESGL